MFFEILTFDFYLEENRQLNATYNLIYTKFDCNITSKRFIGWGKNGELVTWNLQTTS